MIAKNNLHKLPPWQPTYKPLTLNTPSPMGPIILDPSLSAGPYPVQQPRFSGVTHWAPTHTFKRDLAFTSYVHENKLMRMDRTVPIVGNLSSAIELLGLRGFDVLDDFANVPRGARKHTTTSGQFITWECPNYFGKPGTIHRPPKVVLISASGGRLDPANYVADVLDTYFDSIFVPRNLSIILDLSRSVNYNPYSYSVPLNPHNQPFSRPAALDYFKGGELLTIHFNPSGHELLAIDGGVPQYEYYNATRGSYFIFFPGTKYDIVYLANIYTINEEQELINFGDPATDGAAWTSAAGNYSRRRHVIHNATLTGPFATWMLKNVTGGIPPFVNIYGSAPHGHGTSYVANTKPAGMELGRNYNRSTSDYDIIVADMVACIIEDIVSFYTL